MNIINNIYLETMHKTSSDRPNEKNSSKRNLKIDFVIVDMYTTQVVFCRHYSSQ